VTPEAATQERTRLQPVETTARRRRRRLPVGGELLLATLPTLVVLGGLGVLEVFSRQRLLFASLASSAFLIYLDPEHGTNTMRSLVTSHLIAAVAGLATYSLFGGGHLAGGSAMVVTIVLDVIHPPAVSTALSFAFCAGAEQSLVLFGLALGLIAVLVVLQRTLLWLLLRLRPRSVGSST
jgi:CBS-domain-containing membrane protein